MNEYPEPLIKAICFLKKNGDQRNCIYTTSENLVVIIRGRKHSTPLGLIKRISLTKKKLLGPIVIGGIIFSLSGLGILSNFSYPFELMLSLIGGALLFLFGYGGSLAISIETTGGFHYYFIRYTGKNLENFIKYFNENRIKEG